MEKAATPFDLFDDSTINTEAVDFMTAMVMMTTIMENMRMRIVFNDHPRVAVAAVC